MQKKYTPGILAFLFLIMLTLAACERPVPREEPADTPVPVDQPFQPEVLPEQQEQPDQEEQQEARLHPGRQAPL